mgnify:CR=1 FL=1
MATSKSKAKAPAKKPAAKSVKSTEKTKKAAAPVKAAAKKTVTAKAAPAKSAPAKKAVKPAAKTATKEKVTVKAAAKEEPKAKVVKAAVSVKPAKPVKTVAEAPKVVKPVAAEVSAKPDPALAQLAPKPEVPKGKPGRKPTRNPDALDDPEVAAAEAAEAAAPKPKIKGSKAKENRLIKEFGQGAGATEEELEARRTKLKALIKLGKERGFLTYAEINDNLPDNAVDAEAIESIVGTFNDMGIAVYDQAPDAETLLMNDNVPSVASDEDAEEEAEAALSTVDSEFGRTTDPVRMYMREMGSVELLTREGEIEIAKRIEDGLRHMVHAISSCPTTIAQILELGAKIKAETSRVDEVVDGLIDPNAPDEAEAKIATVSEDEEDVEDEAAVRVELCDREGRQRRLGLELIRDELVERLVAGGYRREYQVESLGEVAVRRGCGGCAHDPDGNPTDPHRRHAAPRRACRTIGRDGCTRPRPRQPRPDAQPRAAPGGARARRARHHRAVRAHRPRYPGADVRRLDHGRLSRREDRPDPRTGRRRQGDLRPVGWGRQLGRRRPDP